MIRVEGGSVVISCSRCPVRLDLGPAEMVRHRNRMPSMWASAGGDRHFCPSCAENHMPRFARSPQPSPLFR